MTCAFGDPARAIAPNRARPLVTLTQRPGFPSAKEFQMTTTMNEIGLRAERDEAREQVDELRKIRADIVADRDEWRGKALDYLDDVSDRKSEVEFWKTGFFLTLAGFFFFALWALWVVSER